MKAAATELPLPDGPIVAVHFTAASFGQEFGGVGSGRMGVGSEDRTEAFRRLYQASYGPLTAYARRRVEPNDADDAVAKVFLIAWRRLEDVPPGDEAVLWLYGVARRVIWEDRRSGRRRDRLMAKLSASHPRTELEAVDADRMDAHRAVRIALAKLRENDREVLRLAEWEDLGPTEVGRVLGCSPNAAAIRLHRAHKRFEKALREVEAGLGEARRAEARGTTR
jgi:RNA polymerase sigma-70 factor, ECF subfamily